MPSRYALSRPGFPFSLIALLLGGSLMGNLSVLPADAHAAEKRLLLSQSAAHDPAGVTLYYGGPIHTLTEDFRHPAVLTPETAHQVEAVVVKEGVILFTGSLAEAQKKFLFPSQADKVGTAHQATGDNFVTMVDLCGRTMLPGFVDGHGHFPVPGAAALYQVDLTSPPMGVMTSIEDYISALKRKADELTPNSAAANGDPSWVVGWGYDDSLIREQRHPTMEDLDRVSAVLPVIARHVSAHFMVANSKAFELSGVSKENIPPGGLLDDHTMGLVNIPRPTLPLEEANALMNRAIARASQMYAAVGVTTADQGGTLLHPLERGFTPDEAAIARLAEENVSGLAPDVDATRRSELLREAEADMRTAVTGTASDQVQRWPVDHAGAGHLFEFQQALAGGDLRIRVLTHPLGGNLMGEINRAFLGWDSSGPWEGLPVTNPVGKADIKTDRARTVGDDLTNYRRAEDLPALPPNRLMMGAWKLFMDGSIQGYSGWLKNPGYFDHGTQHDAQWRGGDWENAAETLTAQIGFYHANREPLEVHGNGNMGMEIIVAGFEDAVMQTPVAEPEITDMRHSIIHAQMAELQHLQRMAGQYGDLDRSLRLTDPADLRGAAGNPALRTPELARRMAAQNMVNSYFVNHAYYWGDRHLEVYMGPGRGKNLSPTGWSIALDQPFALHNDAPVTPVSPLRSVQSAVTRLSAPTPTSVPPRPGGTLVSGSGHNLNAQTIHPATKGGKEAAFFNYDQRINVLQALHGITIIPAWQNHVEDRIGSIAPGKLADFVILEQNPFDVARENPEHLAAIPVVATIVGGEVVWGALPGTMEKNN